MEPLGALGLVFRVYGLGSRVFGLGHLGSQKGPCQYVAT